MSSAKGDTLSPDELRKRLYQTFKNKGVLDALKTQLRNQLIRELKQPPLAGGEPVPRAVPAKCEPRLVSACNSIVADHLRTSGYEYTLSVFYPESGLYKDEVSIYKDLFQLLRIGPDSALYSNMVIKYMIQFVLFFLLTQLTHHYARASCHDADTQTTSMASCAESLVEKMKMIDKEYENFSYRGDRWFSTQSKLDGYRKDIEAQAQAEMNTKMQHFKDVEMAKVRMEEKATFHKEFDKLKHDLEKTYEMKAKALMDREKNTIDMLQKQQQIEEKNVYMQRQSVLKEIETLRNRENELRMRTEAFEKTCQIHEENVKSTKELLRRRELAVKTMEDSYDQRLKNELSQYQLELKEEFITRTEKLTENENRNKLETARIQKESAVIDSKLEEHSRACSELRRLQVELETAHQQTSLLSQQNELLRERLESVSDFPDLKREKIELLGQLRLLKKQLEEAQEENRLLHADLGRPSKEGLALQMELQKLQNARRQDEEEFKNQKQVLQAQLQNEMEQCAQFNAQLIECKEKLEWMTKHMDDVKTQLRQTQQAGPMRGHKSPWTDFPDSDTDLVAEAKARLQELQRETEIVEDAYKNYQQRAVHSSISNLLPQRPANPLHRPTSPLRKHISYHSPTLSPHKSKVPHTPLSPQTTTIPSPGLFDTRDIVLAAQPRVTFSEDHNEPQSTVFTGDSLYLPSKPLFVKDEHPPDRSNSPSKHLSSTPHSSPRKSLQREILEGTIKMRHPVKTLQNKQNAQTPQLFHVSRIHIIAFKIYFVNFTGRRTLA
uniref:Uncharacterized protein n=1 Tax=Mola mola TaxID=94237 RepID=A0A3Q3X657_MOLML